MARDSSGRFVKDTDKGYAGLVQRINDMRSQKIAVGIFEGSGAHGETTVLEIATINEFGLGVPERSFIRAWFDENQDRAREAMRRLFISVTEGTRTREEAIEVFGLWVQGEIQARISSGIPPENAASTIAKKGSNTPLIDTGVLRSSITFKIVS